VGLGVGKLGLRERPTDTPSKQACASVGQCELMYVYDKLFDEYGITVSQILLTKTIIETERQKNVENTFKRLLEFGVIPIVNENDTVAIDELELEIGENDSLSAIVAKLCDADLLVILSDIDGLYSSDPHKSDDARLIPVVAEISSYIENIAGGAGSSLGTGGMATKINAGKIATENGIDMVIMNGNDPEKLYDLFEDKPVGTLFLARTDVLGGGRDQ
jgi:glutamate 5-kinase